jgi:hypothetical protein
LQNHHAACGKGRLPVEANSRSPRQTTTAAHRLMFSKTSECASSFEYPSVSRCYAPNVAKDSSNVRQNSFQKRKKSFRG